MNEIVDARREVVRGDWSGGFAGTGRIEAGALSCAISAPAAVGGSGAGENPSALLVSAASGCFLLTLAGLLEQHGVHPVGISIETEGVYGGTAPPELRAVVHRPRVRVDAAGVAQLALVRQCFELAKEACMATRAMPQVAFSVEGATSVEFAAHR
jgi:peroxiredoxin-like protein